MLAAVRSYAIEEYVQPKVLARALKDPKKLPILMVIPAILFLVVGSITGLLDFTPDLSEGIKHYKFFSTWLVDMHMLPAAGFALGSALPDLDALSRLAMAVQIIEKGGPKAPFSVRGSRL